MALKTKMTERLKKIIVCNVDKCNGCQICEFVCSFTKEKVFNSRKSRIFVVRIEPFLNLALTCKKCDDPPCVRACPTEAVQRLSDETIKIDEEKCIGCGWCVEACEFGVMRLNLETGIAFVCDYCRDIGEPQCVKYCPKDALRYITIEQAARELSKKAVKSIVQELLSACITTI
ncbi:MAG: 4Fe-4S dicluster domain-containing protein [Candidatus Brockarchaeota archaeon]|nr:4Fe-4S dicluster domain-containing protein [Candidatus Brockarchaeota archaeon]